MNTALSSLAAWTPLANHLWQSSLFAATIWLLTLALKKNRAAVRYWLWFAASVKFLIPFSALVAFGNRFSWRTAAVVVQAQWTYAVDNAVQPFAASMASAQIASPHASLSLAPTLLVVWLCGVVVGIAFWLKCWTQMRSIRRNATPLPLGLPILVLSSPSQIEPGVFGIFRPVLLLPAGIEERLTPAQLDAILAHEMAHVRRHDNLTAAIHMLVETLFWFFPLAWWLRARLIEERELACDQEVLRFGSEAESYAEGIIQVCKSYLSSPLACASGVTGSDLKKRIEAIITNRPARNLDASKRVLLLAAGALAFISPIAVGIVAAPPTQAQPRQSLDKSAPSYDVTSVKVDPNGDISKPVRSFEPPNGLLIENMTLGLMIRTAYGVKSYQIVGAPAWVDERAYNVEAKLDDAEAKRLAALGKDDQRTERAELLQSLLADRFKLRVHHETRQGPAFALVVAKGGPKFAEAAPDPTKRPLMMEGGRLTFNSAPMATLVTLLSQVMGQTVVDRTSLTGQYAFTIPWTPDEFQITTDNAETATSIFTILSEHLGLRLESVKTPTDTIVIDHIEEPSPN